LEFCLSYYQLLLLTADRDVIANLKVQFSKESIKDYCKTRIAKYAMPRKIEFLDQLPKTKIGKVDYNQLLENVKY